VQTLFKIGQEGVPGVALVADSVGPLLQRLFGRSLVRQIVSSGTSTKAFPPRVVNRLAVKALKQDQSQNIYSPNASRLPSAVS